MSIFDMGLEDKNEPLLDEVFSKITLMRKIYNDKSYINNKQFNNDKSITPIIDEITRLISMRFNINFKFKIIDFNEPMLFVNIEGDEKTISTANLIGNVNFTNMIEGKELDKNKVLNSWNYVKEVVEDKGSSSIEVNWDEYKIYGLNKNINFICWVDFVNLFKPENNINNSSIMSALIQGIVYKFDEIEKMNKLIKFGDKIVSSANKNKNITGDNILIKINNDIFEDSLKGDDINEKSVIFLNKIFKNIYNILNFNISNVNVKNIKYANNDTLQIKKWSGEDEDIFNVFFIVLLIINIIPVLWSIIFFPLLPFTILILYIEASILTFIFKFIRGDYFGRKQDDFKNVLKYIKNKIYRNIPLYIDNKKYLSSVNKTKSLTISNLDKLANKIENETNIPIDTLINKRDSNINEFINFVKSKIKD